jgi:hypothetical protein
MIVLLMKWQLSLEKIAVSKVKRNQAMLWIQHKLKSLRASSKKNLREAASNNFKKFWKGKKEI